MSQFSNKVSMPSAMQQDFETQSRTNFVNDSFRVTTSNVSSVQQKFKKSADQLTGFVISTGFSSQPSSVQLNFEQQKK